MNGNRRNFDEVFTDRLTGVGGLLEMRLTESITFSGMRWIRQPIPGTAKAKGE